MVASGTKSSAALDFGFELLNSVERFRAIMALLYNIFCPVMYIMCLDWIVIMHG